MKIELSKASETTGKSLSTIRRLAKLPNSAPYVDIKDGKILIEVNYLYTIYPAKNALHESKISTPLDTQAIQIIPPNEQLNDLQKKVIELEKKLIEKSTALEYQTKRVEDLQNSIRLLGYEKERIDPPQKRKWWIFGK